MTRNDTVSCHNVEIRERIMTHKQQKGGNTIPENYTRREEDTIRFDHAFYVDGHEELCHHTGYEVFIDGIWWGEFEDRNGDLHYGN